MLRDLLLTVNMVFNVPMYSMLSCFLIYCGLFYWACTTSVTSYDSGETLGSKLSIVNICRSIIWLYLPYIVFFDTFPDRGWSHCSSTTKRIRTFFRTFIGFKWFAEYFSMELVPTCPIPPTEAGKNNHIFLYHPHGIIALGANAALNTGGCSFEKVFPGVERSSVTLEVCFWVPLFRDWMLWNGFITANKKCLKRTLQKESIILVPGGASEALESQPQTMRLHLKHRKGFIKLALETQSPVVPVVGFGENDLWDTLCTSTSAATTNKNKNMLWQIQQSLKRVLTFSMPIMRHVLPNREKVSVVVGEPIQFPTAEVVTQEMVDKCHALYIEKLTHFYNEHKHQYGYGNVPIQII